MVTKQRLIREIRPIPKIRVLQCPGQARLGRIGELGRRSPQTGVWR